MKKGICFAGGGIKCVAHIGALKYFEEKNIKFDYISGTSSGSIVAVLYALGYTSDEMYKIIKKYSKEIDYIEFRKILKLIFDFIFFRKIKITGLNSGNKLEKIIKNICLKNGVKKINDIKNKLLIPCVDLCDGKIIIFSSVENRGYSDNIIYDNNVDISKAIRASCSYPGIFSPVKYKNRLLIDGGIRENIPWKELKEMGAEEIWCITFSKELNENCERNILEVVKESISILCHELSIYELIGIKDLVNVEVGNIGLLENKKIDYLYQKGYMCAESFVKNKLNIKK